MWFLGQYVPCKIMLPYGTPDETKLCRVFQRTPSFMHCVSSCTRYMSSSTPYMSSLQRYISSFTLCASSFHSLCRTCKNMTARKKITSRKKKITSRKKITRSFRRSLKLNWRQAFVCSEHHMLSHMTVHDKINEAAGYGRCTESTYKSVVSWLLCLRK